MSTDLDKEAQESAEQQVKGGEDKATEKLGSEGRTGLPELAEQHKATRDALKAGARSGITGDFGKPVLFDNETDVKALEKTLTTPLADDSKPGDAKPGDAKPGDAKPADKPAEVKVAKSPEEAAKDFEKQGRDELAAIHKDLKVTTDGSPPRTFPYEDQHKVTTAKTPMELAEEKLGPNATKEQKEYYAQKIVFMNDLYEGGAKDPENQKIKEGTTIKLPGQTADGGIVEVKGSTTRTEWADGSGMDVSADGKGGIRYNAADGSTHSIRWNPQNQKGTYEEISTNDTATVRQANGKTEYQKYNAKTEDWETTRVTETDSKGREYSYEFKSGEGNPYKVVVTNPDKSTVDLARTKDGEYVSADGKTGMDKDWDVYSRSAGADGSVTKTYDNGYKATFDKKGRITHEEGKDGWGREYSQDYKAGEKSPHTVKVIPKPGEPAIEFKRGKANEYSADYLDAGGKKIGKINLGFDGRIVYKDDATKTQRTELKDGTTVEMQEHKDGTKTRTAKLGNESVATEIGANGKLTKEVSTTADGRVMTFVKDEKASTVTIENPDKSKTELKWDAESKSYKGQRTDASGKAVENVTFLEDKFVYTDIATGQSRAEKFTPPTNQDTMTKFTPGEYDKNTGNFSYKKPDGTIVVESFSPGRTVELKTDGSWSETTIRGEKAYSKPTGETGIQHPDGTGVRINPDGTIDRWGPEPSDNALGEKCTPGEAKYLDDHPHTDKALFAEIHRRFQGDATKIDAFYSSLEKIDTAKNLSPEEKEALRDNLMHHVANPEEIYQGRSPSCNVSVIQREMAINNPAKYVDTVVTAVSEGELTKPDGTKVPLDPNNLKMMDSSGRDLASRIFQNTAIQTQFHPQYEYKNTEDGVGRLYTTPVDASTKPIVFNGMSLPEIAEARYKITGEQKGMALVENENELLAAWEANGKGPMTIAVDGTSAPFKPNGPVGKGNLNHVVTITHIDKGPPMKVYLQNQWGLENDHSTKETAVEAKDLLANMRKPVKLSDGSTSKLPAMVLTAGDSDKVYEVKKGKVVENPTLSEKVRKLRPQRTPTPA